MKTGFAITVLTTLAFAPLATAQDAALTSAERARGILTGNTGVEWIVSVNTTGGSTRSAKFRAVSQNGKIRAEVLEPADSKGNEYIAESSGNMWFWKPGVSRPVSVSKRERLSGDAAIGDIASTSYVDGYKIEGKADGDVNGEPATVYTMKANSLGDTYAEIRYWVTKKGNLGKKAEFYSRGGTLMRTATMEYNNSAGGGAFLSKMVVKESSRTVTMSFSNIKIGSYPSSLFDKDTLGGGRPKTGKRQ